MQLKTGVLANAFELTYGRALTSETSDARASLISGFTGWQTKYKSVTKIIPPHLIELDWEHKIKSVEKAKDKNKYNWFEQVAFGLPRLAKNTAKLFTEFMWHALSGYAEGLAHRFNYESKKDSMTKTGKALFTGLYYLTSAFSAVFKVVAKIGEIYTSPIKSTKDAYNSMVQRIPGKTGKVAGFILAGIFVTISSFALAKIAIFALPTLASASVGLGFAAAGLMGAKVLLRKLFEPKGSDGSSPSAAAAAAPSYFVEQQPGHVLGSSSPRSEVDSAPSPVISNTNIHSSFASPTSIISQPGVVARTTDTSTNAYPSVSRSPLTSSSSSSSYSSTSRSQTVARGASAAGMSPPPANPLLDHEGEGMVLNPI